MDKLNRKQCNAILRARSSMPMVKENYKKQYESNLLCRFCDKHNETQEHILQDCTKIKRTKEKIIYSKIFEEDTEPLREIANEIIKIEECFKEPQLHSMSSSNRSEPPGWPGRMHIYYYYSREISKISSIPAKTTAHKTYPHYKVEYGPTVWEHHTKRNIEKLETL